MLLKNYIWIDLGKNLGWSWKIFVGRDNLIGQGKIRTSVREKISFGYIWEKIWGIKNFCNDEGRFREILSPPQNMCCPWNARPPKLRGLAPPVILLYVDLSVYRCPCFPLSGVYLSVSQEIWPPLGAIFPRKDLEIWPLYRNGSETYLCTCNAL